MLEKLQKFIKPGEFTFCNRCGRSVRYGSKNFMCTGCVEQMFHSVDKRPPDEKREILLKIDYEDRISCLIMEHREKLAKLRQNQGGE
jgi:hypothetical protein